MNDRRYMRNIVELTFSQYKFVVYYAETLNQWIAEFPHHHPQYEIYYVLEGNVQINIAGTVHDMQEGEAYLLAKDIKHHVYYNPDIPKRYFAMIFDLVPYEQLSFNGTGTSAEYDDICRGLAIVDNMGFQRLREPAEMHQLEEKLFAEMDNRELGWNSQVVMLCYQIFLQTLRQIRQDPVQDSHFAGTENLAMQISMYIHEHYTEDISVESVAEALNVSTRHVNRAYKAMFSTTFMKNTNLLRVAYAKNYLCSTRMSVEEIAERVGFTSMRTLSKLFLQYEGLSPSQYREQHKEGYETEAPKPEDDCTEERTLPDE